MPAAVLWALVLPLMLLRGPALLYAALVVNVFMSLQMLPGAGGGATLLPVTVYQAALVGKIALTPGNVARGLEAALDMRRLGLFTGFMCFGLLSAILLPRMFAGLVEVIPVSGASLDGPSLLQPRASNFTQSGYMIVSYLTAVGASVIGTREEFRRHFLRALIVAALALFLTGLADLLASRLGLSSLLESFRTANYELLTDAETAGVKRVVGLTPEASSFGALCVQTAAALLLLRPLYRGWERFFATLALAGVAAMALLSTSATAYVGGAVLALVYLIDLIGRAARPGAMGRETVGLEIGMLILAVICGIVAIVFMSEAVAPLYALLDKILFQKSASISYYQRSMWTTIGWGAFLDSGGMGAGLGSVRTSNWFMSILASTGVLGSALLFGFIAQRITTRFHDATRDAAALHKGLKLWLFPTLVMSMLAGTIPDLGILLSIAVGVLSTGAVAASQSQFAKRTANPPERIPIA